jgi:hypothetical protein
VEAYKTQLRQLLVDHGWEVVAVSNTDDWWADEYWKVESRRNAWDLQIVLIFLVDPLWDTPRKKGQGVWAVSVTEEIPPDRISAEQGIAQLCMVKGRYDEKLAALIDSLDAYRNSRS